MALTLQFFIGRLLNRNEALTTAKVNAMVKGMSANLSGSVGTANIDDGAITTAKVQPGPWWYATAVLGGTTYTAAYVPVVAGYMDGLFLAFKADAANVGACSFDAGAGAKALTKWGGTALEANDIVAGEIMTVRYNATIGPGSWELVNTPRTPVADRTLIGSVVAYAGIAAPAGWLECDGSAILRLGTYAKLFAAIGETWGAGDGVTTFKLPDVRGYFVRGWDHGAGIDAGRAIATTQVDDVKPHAHYLANSDSLNNTLPALTNANQLAKTAFGGSDNPDYQLCGTNTAATIGLTSGVANTRLATVAVHAAGGGAGYVVGDILTIAGGTGTAATVTVTGVAAGVITSVAVRSVGDYSIEPTLVSNGATGGTGAGASLDLTMVGPTESRPKNVSMMHIIKF